MKSLIQPVQQLPAPTTYPNFASASYPVYHHQTTPSSVPTTPPIKSCIFSSREPKLDTTPSNQYKSLWDDNARVSSTLTRPTSAQSLNFDREISYSEQLTDYPSICLHLFYNS